MTTYTRAIKKLLMVAAAAQILLGMVHFILPGLVDQLEGFQQLSSSEKDLVTLCVFSVGILLLAAGIITSLCAVKYEVSKEISRSITTVLAILWGMRIILEIVFPVKIPLLFMNNPTYFMQPVFIVLFALLAITVFLMIKDKRS